MIAILIGAAEAATEHLTTTLNHICLNEYVATMAVSAVYELTCLCTYYTSSEDRVAELEIGLHDS